ncbi:MAG: M14 family metallopeptidase [Pseudomonadota bacterium]
MIRHLHHIPDGLLDARADSLHRFLDGMTVIHLEGRRQPPIFISVLQHGNEDSGWEAVRRLLQRNPEGKLPRSVILLIANVEAARYGLRRLDHQPDFNRCWPGGPPAATAVHRALAELTDQIRAVGPLLSLDIHNNSGRNPHYAAINRLDVPWLHLAQSFDRRAVYFQHPKGTQSDTFSHFCPAITLECGKAGTTNAVSHCLEFLERVLNWESLPDEIELDPEFELFHTVARTTVAPGVEFQFGAEAASITFVEHLESLNFKRLEPDTVLGELRESLPGIVHAITHDGVDVTGRYFKLDHAGRLVVANAFVPAMFSTDERVVRQDCLCYVMEPMELPRMRGVHQIQDGSAPARVPARSVVTGIR